MNLREHVSLRELTTFRIGGEARYVAECESIEDVQTALTLSRERGLPLVALGEGSNVLASDRGFHGIVLRLTEKKISHIDEGAEVLVVASAGTHWDDVVEYATAQSLWGIENLAGIPGTTGAAPVQNIGAYGRELADTFVYADVYDTKSSSMIRLSKDECGFGYRESRFKYEPNLIILSVALRLQKAAEPQIAYKDLQARRDAGDLLDTPQQIAKVVRSVRAQKFPDLTKEGTAGSFFKNPTIPAEAYEALQEKYPELPGFPNTNGVKIPLAFILDKVLTLRGFRVNSARLFESQPLVLVADEGATENDVNTLAEEVVAKVRNATGVLIEREVRSLA